MTNSLTIQSLPLSDSHFLTATFGVNITESHCYDGNFNYKGLPPNYITTAQKLLIDNRSTIESTANHINKLTVITMIVIKGKLCQT